MPRVREGGSTSERHPASRRRRPMPAACHAATLAAAVSNPSVTSSPIIAASLVASRDGGCATVHGCGSAPARSRRRTGAAPRRTPRRPGRCRRPTSSGRTAAGRRVTRRHCRRPRTSGLLGPRGRCPARHPRRGQGAARRPVGLDLPDRHRANLRRANRCVRRATVHKFRAAGEASPGRARRRHRAVGPPTTIPGTGSGPIDRGCAERRRTSVHQPEDGHPVRVTSRPAPARFAAALRRSRRRGGSVTMVAVVGPASASPSPRRATISQPGASVTPSPCAALSRARRAGSTSASARATDDR